MAITGSYDDQIRVEWDAPTDLGRRTWADEEVATEHGAYGCAMLVVEELAGLRVVQRSRKGTGFDWWLGEAASEGPLFQNRARLEVSGIRNGADRIEERTRRKRRQVGRSDSTGLDALVVVVEFGMPQSNLERQT